MTSSDVLEFSAFQKMLLSIYDRVSGGKEVNSSDVLAAMSSCQEALTPATPPAYLRSFDRFAQLIALNLNGPERSAFLEALRKTPNSDGPAALLGCANKVMILGELSPLRADGADGISLVTCCMNRGANLVKSLRSWLAIDRLSEIIIVDWSSREPVVDLLKAEGLVDRRIHVARVDGEPRWILSYAFNVGFRLASRNQILKADADIVLAPGFFEGNSLIGNNYIAGNWQEAPEDQAFVNGFFFVSKQALHSVGGFNEFITSYGWDDDDLYNRLSSAGYNRRKVVGHTIFHLEHTDAERIANAGDANDTTFDLDRIVSSTAFHIQKNRALARMMPKWTGSSDGMGYNTLEQTENFTRLVRQSRLPRMVPERIAEAAVFQGLREVASWHIGEAAHRIPQHALKLLLSRPRSEITKIDVAVALSSRPQALQSRGQCVVISLPVGLLEAPPRDFSHAIEALLAAAAEDGLRLVIRSTCKVLPENAPAVLRAFPLIHESDDLGSVTRMSAKAFLERHQGGKSGNLLIQIHESDIGTMPRRSAGAPSIITKRKNVFIDAQHGLGNRLRAIGSAAAIAKASERDLVIVWQRDHHCDCEFSDLYDYSGPVISERFVHAASELGMDVFNYMPGEANSQKDVEIVVNPFREVYLRSAFALKHPASNLEEENYFIRSLKPAAVVRALVESVPSGYRLAAHVRMEGAAGQRLASYDDQSNWTEEDHRLIQFWRSNSDAARFTRRIDELIAEGKNGVFFLATDMESTYRLFEQKYGEAVLFLKRENYDRSRQQLQYALADAILLSRAQHLLASNWSSFSELAMRLAPNQPKVEYSGRDF